MDNDDKISKLNKKFNIAMTKFEKYNGTDPESIVQQAYNKYFQAYFKLDDTSITRVEKCDSYFIKDKLVVLAEYKFNVDFNDVLTRAKVIAQTLIYYKKIVDKGKDTIPNVVFIGDVNDCFCLKTKHFSKHMSYEGVDYSVAASSISSQMKLVQAIVDDIELQNDIFIINPQKDPMSYICEKMAAMSFDKDAKIPITLKNVTRVFEAFSTKICADKKYSSNEMVGLFIDAIRYPEKRIIGGDYLVVPPYKPMKVNTMKAIGLFKFFGKPSDTEAKELTQIYDTLVKDDDRRRHGFFITPSLWSDLGHKYVADYFKKIGFIEDGNWEGSDKIVCWDCCCGTKSLTKSYRFKNLYLSTLEQSELNASTELSPEAKETFVFDFLNDPISKLPESLKNELQNLRHTDKKCVFFVNPPYGRTNGIKGLIGKTGICKTSLQEKMKAANCGMASQELIVQFLFKMTSIAEEFKLNKDQLIISTFSNPTFMCGNSYKNFRKWFLDRMAFNSGFIFQSSEFEGCSEGWPISFSIWHNVSSIDVENFKHDTYESCEDGVNIIGTKLLYNADNSEILTLKNLDKTYYMAPDSANGLNIGFNKLGKWHKDAIASAFFNGKQGNSFFSMPVVSGQTEKRLRSFVVFPENADDAVAMFGAFCFINSGWQNDKDVYVKPNIKTNKYLQFVNDSYIIAIDSYTTSVSGTVDGIAYDYKNNFFPFSKAETYKLLGQELMKNEVDEKRWCLANGKFDNPSPEGKAVLDAFAACIKASAPFRRDFWQSHPELQLDHWDAGYRQLKQLFSEVCINEFKQFKTALRTLKTKMQPLIYELGFLRK